MNLGKTLTNTGLAMIAIIIGAFSIVTLCFITYASYEVLTNWRYYLKYEQNAFFAPILLYLLIGIVLFTIGTNIEDRLMGEAEDNE